MHETAAGPAAPVIQSWRVRARLAIGAVLLSALSLVGFSFAYASFSGVSSTSQAATTAGPMALTVGGSGSSNRLTIASPTLLAGSTEERTLTLTTSNPGASMSGVRLTITGDNGPPTFVTDATDGLNIWIASCSVPWSESGTNPDYTYSCTGSQSDALGTNGEPVPVLQTAAALSGLSTNDGADNFLRVKLTLPATAPSTMSNQTSALTFSFDGTQRAGVSR